MQPRRSSATAFASPSRKTSQWKPLCLAHRASPAARQLVDAFGLHRLRAERDRQRRSSRLRGSWRNDARTPANASGVLPEWRKERTAKAGRIEPGTHYTGKPGDDDTAVIWLTKDWRGGGGGDHGSGVASTPVMILRLTGLIFAAKERHTTAGALSSRALPQLESGDSEYTLQPQCRDSAFIHPRSLEHRFEP